MRGTTRLLLRLARSVAGKERSEWLDAMAAETAASGQSMAWAAGCVWASLKDRLVRDEQFLLAILLMPLGVFLLQALVFFPAVWFSRRVGLPGWSFIVVFLLMPLPFTFALARRMSLRRALIGSALSSFAFDLIGIAIFWIQFGKGPAIWFKPGSQIYNMAPVLGWTCSLSVWLMGAWLGFLSQRRRAT